MSPVPALRRRATGHNARERGTGERRDAGAAGHRVRRAGICLTAAMGISPLACGTDAVGSTAATSARERDTGERRDAGATAGTCRIVARRLPVTYTSPQRRIRAGTQRPSLRAPVEYPTRPRPATT